MFEKPVDGPVDQSQGSCNDFRSSIAQCSCKKKIVIREAFDKNEKEGVLESTKLVNKRAKSQNFGVPKWKIRKEQRLLKDLRKN